MFGAASVVIVLLTCLSEYPQLVNSYRASNYRVTHRISIVPSIHKQGLKSFFALNHNIAALSANDDNNRDINEGSTNFVEQASVKSNAHSTLFSSTLSWLSVIWDFSRPHTLVGSALSILSLYAYAIPRELWFSAACLKSIVLAAIPSFLMNIYITGLNQITDVDIDKINKPYLPIAANRLDLSHAKIIVSLCLVVSLAFAYVIDNWPLRLTLLASGFLGTIYSMPPFRLKRFPLLAAFCILAVRGSIVNLGFIFSAKTQVLGQVLPNLATAIAAFPESIAVTTFFALFGVVIALMKDVPDVLGDKQYQIPSFSVRMGPQKMFRLSWLLLVALLGGSGYYLGSSKVLAAVHLFGGWSLPLRRAVGVAFLALAADVTRKALRVDALDSKNVFSFYMYVWKVFYASYLLLPFMQ